MRRTVFSFWTIARWEVRRSLTTMSRRVLPAAVALFILLLLATGFAAESGIHMQDRMYIIGADDQEVARIFAGDERFLIYLEDPAYLRTHASSFDVLIIDGIATGSATERSRAAMKALARDYARYEAWVYTQQEDLFAAYPLWLELEPVKSELDFLATESGQYLGARPRERSIDPEGPVESIPEPASSLDIPAEDLRSELARTGDLDSQLSRYTEILSPEEGPSGFSTPSQLSPALPFDSIILVFVFIFPLYFTSQFYMMSIMNERVERKGEILLSSPAGPLAIITGKALPYFVMMLAISALLTLANGAPLTILLPLIPVILFFLASALVIGMVSRSFKELSFISIFFSTVATAYLFFPSIFANVHVVSMVSPLTLIVLELQGEGFTAADYLYSTSLFYLVSILLLYVGTVNFTEERLFGQHRFLARIREFIGTTISQRRPFASLLAISAFSIPFVFMVQLLLLVLLFNLPPRISLVLLLVSAAFVEEAAKSVGIYTILRERPGWLDARNLLLASAAVALGFLAGEKALLFATLAQISESVFGTILFSSLQVLWLPLSLHFAGVLTTASVLKLGGPRWYFPGLLAATIVHSLYNMYFILGWLS